MRTPTANPEAVKVRTSEIIDGVRYRGTMTIRGIALTYEMRLPVSLEQLDQFQSEPRALLHAISLEVSVGERKLKLDEGQKSLLVGLGIMEASHLFDSSIRRTLRRGGIDTETLGEGGGALAQFESNNTYDVKSPLFEGLCELLRG